MDNSQYTHDVYISFSDADELWVREWLVPRLLKANVTVYHAFEPGVPKLVNIEQAVATSRHTLLVLTPSWVTDEWESFAGLLARSEDPIGQRRRTIPLSLQNCTPPRAIARLI